MDYTQVSKLLLKRKVTYSKFAKCKNQKLKEFYHSNHTTYRNLLSTLLKRAKEKQFTKFFNENIKDIRRTWIGIKSLLISDIKT